MSTIAELLNDKHVTLPPLQGVQSDMPSLVIVAPQEPRPVPIPQPKNPSFEDPSNELTKSAPYTLYDDLSIFNVIMKYYGDGFHGKIPWSFWQTYKRVSGSNRSNSSLYHHWNGAMKKKYESFIVTGRLSECVAWLETAIAAESNPAPFQQDPMQHTGAPLIPIRSQPPVPLMPRQPIDTPAPLIRTMSYIGQPFPFMKM